MKTKMSINEFIERAKEHKKWLNGQAEESSRLTLINIDLSKKRIENLDLTDAIFKNVDFNDSFIINTNLSYSMMKNCSFSSSVIDGTLFKGAEIDNVNFLNASLAASNFDFIRTREIDFTNTEFSHCSFISSQLSNTKGLINSIDYLNKNFEKTKEGYIAYKLFEFQYKIPEYWDIKENGILNEVVDANRFDTCSYGINVATLEWIEENLISFNNLYKIFSNNEETNIWKVLIPFEWLSGVCVPYNTDGKIRCERVKLLRKITKEELSKERTKYVK